MNLTDYLDPVSLEKPDEYFISRPNLFGKEINIHTPDFEIGDLNQYSMAILGVPEDRNSFNKGSSLAPEKIRGQLYQLNRPGNNLKIIDLGNLKQGNTFNDTYTALREVLQNLLENNITVILVGGTQELTIPVFQNFERTRNDINLTTIDRTLDVVKDTVRTTAETYLTEILFKKRSLFKYCNLGHQIHITDKNNVDLVNKLYHNAYRLGEIRSEISLVEPILRDTDIVSFDISAIRQSDAPAFFNPSPSGFTSEEACQLARYSGLSDRLSVFGVFEMNPKFDILLQSANLAAQIIWYFIDGFGCRIAEMPASGNKNFKTFIVGNADLDYEITFYKSTVTDRWWMEVPNLKKDGPMIISCSYSDYKQACEQEVPDLWLKSFQKLS
ncbi:MAG: formimidoylglutamase [Bacteroidales bacterium]|nr:formimidoylglutamase [Bacteroidales bacterium]